MKPFDLKKSVEIESLLTVVGRERSITETGGVTVTGHYFYDAPTVIASLLKLSKDVSFEEAEKYIDRALKSSSLRAAFNSRDLIDLCNELYSNDHTSRRETFHTVTTLLAPIGVVLPTIVTDGVSISYDPTPAQWNKHLSIIKDYFPEGYDDVDDRCVICCVASTNALDADEAFRKSRKALDLYRGALNLGINHTRYMQTSYGRNPQPLNTIRGGKYFTVLDANDDSSHRNLHYLESWTWPKFKALAPEKLTDYNHRIERYAGRLVELRHPLRSFSDDAMVMYCRAADSNVWQYSFLELWTVLERLCVIQETQSHSKIVERVSRLYSDKQVTRAFLDHLRVRRNNMVHGGYSEPHRTSERLLFQLNRYVSDVLFFIFTNKLKLRSVDEWVQFLDLPQSLEALKAQKTLLDQAIGFHTPA